MGKGSGSCTRPSLHLGATAVATPSSQQLKDALKDASSSVERAAILAQWNRDTPLVNEDLGTEDEYVQAQLDEAQERIRSAAERTVFGYHWQKNAVEHYAIEHDTNIRTFDDAVERLFEKIGDCDGEIEHYTDEAEDEDADEEDQLNAQLEVEAAEERKQNYDDQVRTIEREKYQYIAQEYGTVNEDGLYQPGIQDLTDMLNELRTTKEDQVAEAIATCEADYREIARAMYAFNAHRPQPSNDPNWQPQSLDALDPLLDNQGRAVLFQKSLLRDDVVYISRKRHRYAVNGAESFIGAMAIEDAINNACYDNELPCHLDDYDVAQGITFQTASWYPTADDWMPHLQSYPGFEHYTADEQQQIAAAVAADTHGSYLNQKKKQVFIDGDEHVWGESDVSVRREEALIAALIDRGATVHDSALELPTYQSRHDINSGQHLQLKVDDTTTIVYTPHHSCGTHYGDVPRVQQTLALDEPQVQQQLRDAWEQSLVTNHGAPTEQWYQFTSAQGLVEFHCDNEFNSGFPQDRKILTSLHEAGGSMGNDQSGRHYRLVTDDDLAASGHIKVSGGWLKPDQADAVAHSERALQALQGATYTVESLHDDSTERDTHLTQQLQWGVADMTENPEAQTWLRTVLPAVTLPTTQTAKFERNHVPQMAPMSERGQLRVMGETSDAVVAALGDIGAVGPMHTEVPLGLMHTGGAGATVMPPGRLTPPRPDYAAGINHLTLPEGHMVMHGLTGASEEADVQQRLRMLVENGGLLSIAERTRRGMKLKTMSPLGDIASGIDRGVPCSINKVSRYGSHVFFAMKPEILQRRDVWFSDRDFGSGDNRYEQYTQYAQSIGQRRIYDSPSHTARQKHLHTGLAMGNNEVYFQDAVNMHEVDTIFLSAETPQGLHERLALLKELRDNGSLPPTVRVECVQGKYNHGSKVVNVLPAIGDRVADRAHCYEQASAHE